MPEQRVSRTSREIAHILLVWLLTVPAITPLVQPTLSRSADGLLHLYRLVALNQTLTQGEILFPRWLPDLAYGYGFPLFVFYAPLSYYITLLPTLLGLPLFSTFNLSFGLALLVGGSGAYLFVRALFGPKAGLLAAAAYIYAPFQILNTLFRGGLPAAWAMALFPFGFWCFALLLERLDRLESKSFSLRSLLFTPLLPLSALVLGIALLMHNTLSLLFVPLLFFYLGLALLVRLVQPGPTREKWLLAVQMGVASLLGFGLAGFFLIPAIIERKFVQIQRVITPPDFDFHFHFVSLSELFSLPLPANTGLLNPDIPLTLGLPQVGLAALGLLGLLVHSLPFSMLQKTEAHAGDAKSQTVAPSKIQSRPSNEVKALKSKIRTILAFSVISLAVAIFMMLPVSVNVWEELPLLAFVQFPHRLLGPAALILALLAGAAVATLPERWGFGLTITGIILIFATTIPMLYPRYYSAPTAEPSLLQMMTYERDSGVIGTTSFGEYLPIWVKTIPGGSGLESMYHAGETIERLDVNSLPPRSTVEIATYSVNQADITIDSPTPYQAIFQTFYFPGWQAQIDGRPTSIEPVGEQGVIGIKIPAGRHRLQLSFQETPIRKAANTLSIGALTIILIMATIATFSRHGATKVDILTAPTPRFSRLQMTGLLALSLTLIGLKLLYLDHFDNPLKQNFDGQTVTAAEEPLAINFGDQINLLGYTLDRTAVEPGQPFNLTLYWQARYPLAGTYSALAQLVDADRNLYVGQDNLHPGEVPTTRWQAWGFIRDEHTILVPPGTPPGDYFLATGLYEPHSLARLPVLTASDSSWGDVISIPVHINRPEQPPSLPDLGIKWPISAEFEPDLRLLGATPERDSIHRRDFLRLALFWEARNQPATDYTISLRLITSGGDTVWQASAQPSHNRYPTTLWKPGERVRDTHAIWVPADFPAGTYRVQVQLHDKSEQSLGDWVELGALSTVE